MKQLKNIAILLCTLLIACNTEPPQKPSQMVLEAWIDAEGYPVVLIHNSYILANAPDTVTALEEIIEEQLIPFGKVVVSDGENEVVLTGRLDTLYLPPYTYTTTDIEGEVGKIYTVTATYEDLKATATTTIPPVATLDSLAIISTQIGKKDVHAYLTTDSINEAYYVLFARKKGTKQYQICPFGVFTSRDSKDGKIDMMVYNPTAQDGDFAGVNNYFNDGDSATYQLKVARVDYASYQFWKAYNEQAITRGVLFVPMYSNIPGNVEGGIGNFTGMGSSVYRFDLLTDTVFHYK